MRRRAKPPKVKVQGQLPVAKTAKSDDARVRDLEKRLAEAVKREAEAREQQTATAEILRVISNSPSDYQPVFDTIVRNAGVVCGAADAMLWTVEGDELVVHAHHGPLPARIGARQPIRGSVAGHAVHEARVIHIEDVTAADDFPVGRDIALRLGWRTVLSAPLLRAGFPIGAILIRRREVRPFTESQIVLLQTFADQAVIAIENVRLFHELEEKNRALTQAHAQVTESLEHQTATSEILRVISRSPTDVQPVFDTIAEAAMRLCGAHSSLVTTFDGELLHLIAQADISPEGREVARDVYPRRPSRGSASGRTVMTRAIVQIPDVTADPEYDVQVVPRVRDFRSILAVPMLRNGLPIGTINAHKAQPGPFTDKQIALLQTFADQAVIAIENARLFTELQEKNRALTQAHAQVTAALEQQTATSEILRVISSSPTDIQPVFTAIVERAVHLCGARFGRVYRYDGELIHMVAGYGLGAIGLAEVRRVFPRAASDDTIVGRVILTRQPALVRGIDREEGLPALSRRMIEALETRSQVTIPMLRAERPIGAITLGWAEPEAFDEQQIALLKTFADQAVIAIENVRLFKELEARTGALTRSVEQLTALGEVGRAVSSTLDLETVLTTIVSRAVQLSGLDGGVVFEYDEDAEEFVHRAATETGGALAEVRRAIRIRKGEGVLGRTAITLEAARVPDITLPGAYEGRLRGSLIESGVRAILAVPMVREDRLIGCLVVSRNRPGDFPAETVDLLRTFATQSALAIQNARLFHEIEDKSRQLEAASRHKSEFLANMSHELRTPLNAVIGFSEVLLQRMFGELNARQDEYLKDIYASGQHLLSLINDILDLSKIEAGRMELTPAPFHLPTVLENAVTLVKERASRHGIALQLDIDPRLGELVGDERKVKQVLLNLLSNAVKFTPEGGRISLKAARGDGLVEIAVTDTGIGIAPEDQAAIFEEFRQVGSDETRKQEGTGLGLTLAKKFVELHGGRIWVESEPGRGSAFTFTLPVS